jgi:hypothetical protein
MYNKHMSMQLETVEDLRKALDTTLDHLEGVLSSDPDMPSYQSTYDDASNWLDAMRAAREVPAAGRRNAVPPPPPASAPGRSSAAQTQLPSTDLSDSTNTTIPSPPPSAHDVNEE